MPSTLASWPSTALGVSILLAIPLCLVHCDPPPSMPMWTVSNSGILLSDGRPTKLVGFNYQPGGLPSCGNNAACAFDPDVYEQDFKYMQSMNVNAISLYSTCAAGFPNEFGCNQKQFCCSQGGSVQAMLDAAQQYGLNVLFSGASFPDGSWQPGDIEKFIASYATLANLTLGHPAALGIIIGQEANPLTVGNQPAAVKWNVFKQTAQAIHTVACQKTGQDPSNHQCGKVITTRFPGTASLIPLFNNDILPLWKAEQDKFNSLKINMIGFDPYQKLPTVEAELQNKLDSPDVSAWVQGQPIGFMIQENGALTELVDAPRTVCCSPGSGYVCQQSSTPGGIIRPCTDFTWDVNANPLSHFSDPAQNFRIQGYMIFQWNDEWWKAPNWIGTESNYGVAHPFGTSPGHINFKKISNNGLTMKDYFAQVFSSARTGSSESQISSSYDVRQKAMKRVLVFNETYTGAQQGPSQSQLFV